MHPVIPTFRPMPAPASRAATRVWIALYLALFALLMWGAGHGLRIRCEGFGCVGLGVYWFAWACVCAVTGLLGLWADARARRADVMAELVRGVLWLQGLSGLGLLARWQWPF